MAVPHAQLVGNSFIGQYYNVLHQSPHVAHRFYTNASCLTRAEAGPEGRADTVYSQSGIHEKVMSLDYAGLRAEIKTVDCQDSYSGSVLVMVTGSLSNRSNVRRDFVQTFFLAPQEKGYFVLNDIFRYLDEPQVSTMPYVLANGPPQEQPSTAESVADPTHLEVSETTPVTAEEPVVDEGYDINDAEEEVLVEETAQPVPLDSEEVLDTEDAQHDLPKKSYASILRVVKGGQDGVHQVQHVVKVSATVTEKPVSPSGQTVEENTVVPPPPAETVEESTTTPDIQSDGRAIYIKNLPMTITPAQLEEEFQKFGAVKSGGINVKKQNGVCYAFLEFEDATSARAAVQASTVQINGKAAFIEEKKPLSSRSNRGRGRGRSDGSRGRGYYRAGPGATVGASSGGGRGYEPSNRGRGSRGYNAANPDARGNSEDGSSYHPRSYDNAAHNYANNSNITTSGGNSNNHNNYNNNNQSYPNPRPRRFFRNSNSTNSNPSFARNSTSSGAPPAASATPTPA